MKNLFLTLLLFSFSTALFAQKKESFDKLIKEAIQFLKVYNELSPYPSDQYYSLRDFGLTKQEIKEIQDTEDVYNFNSEQDSISNFGLIELYQIKIVNQLKKIAAHKNFWEQDIKRYLDNEDLSVVKSDDGMLYCFMLDGKSGGTYQSRVSVVCYKGQPAALISGTVNDSRIYKGFNSDGYSEIYSLESGIRHKIRYAWRGKNLFYVLYSVYSSGLF